MSALKSFLKKIPGIQKLHWHLGILRDFHMQRAISYENRPIRVGFLCQYIPAWSKVSLVYSKMLEDDRFEPYIICVPMDVHKLLVPEENEIYQYISQAGYDCLNAITEDGQWLSLEDMHLDYIFYPRPYNSPLPEPYQTYSVCRHSKICILMYGITFAEEDAQVALNTDFMSRVSFYFAETPYMKEKNIQQNRLAHSLGFQKTLCLGLPVFETLIAQKEDPAPAWNFSKNNFRVFWTPRWTTDKSLGGSNFLYYEKLLAFAKENPDIDFLHRPHPLAFSHFVEKGILTQEQIDDYQQSCNALPNVKLDDAPQYDTTLWGSSVMVSDISGIMPEFFITDKPLIFCSENMELKLAPFTKVMLEGCYIAKNAEEIFETLKMLKNGDDPLKEKRIAIRRTLFGDFSSSPSDNILNTLFSDFHR